jgi:hypothetical protein
MRIDVTPAFVDQLARNRGPDPSDPMRRCAPDYSIVATLEASVLEVELTFRAGCSYCCYEWGCHVSITPLAKRWDALRSRLLDLGIQPPLRIELHRTVVIQEGAIFFDFSKPDLTRRGWYSFAPVTANRFQWVTIEVPIHET